MMKNLLLITFSFLFFTSCQEKQKDDSLIKQAIGNSLNEVKAISAGIKREFNKGMRKPPDKKVYLESQKFKGWREEYYKNKNKVNLLAYSDSIAYEFHNNDWNIDYLNSTYPFIKQLDEKKLLVRNAADSFIQQELLYWTLEAEKYLQNNLAAKLGSDCRFNPPADVFLNGEKFKLGDTVYATFEIPPKLLDGLRYKSDSLFITNLDTKEHISKSIIQSGPYFIIQIIPEQKGTYMLTGEMKFYLKQYKKPVIYVDFDKKPFQVN